MYEKVREREKEKEREREREKYYHYTRIESNDQTQNLGCNYC